MSDSSTQLRGLGGVEEKDTAGTASARRKARSSDSGKFHLHNRSATDLLCYKVGDLNVDCTGLANADGFLAPGESYVVECDATHISIIAVTPTQDCVIGEVE